MVGRADSRLFPSIPDTVVWRALTALSSSPTSVPHWLAALVRRAARLVRTFSRAACIPALPASGRSIWSNSATEALGRRRPEGAGLPGRGRGRGRAGGGGGRGGRGARPRTRRRRRRPGRAGRRAGASPGWGRAWGVLQGACGSWSRSACILGGGVVPAQSPVQAEEPSAGGPPGRPARPRWRCGRSPPRRPGRPRRGGRGGAAGRPGRRGTGTSRPGQGRRPGPGRPPAPRPRPRPRPG